jgi:hypothetical protein
MMANVVYERYIEYVQNGQSIAQGKQYTLSRIKFYRFLSKALLNFKDWPIDGYENTQHEDLPMPSIFKTNQGVKIAHINFRF